LNNLIQDFEKLIKEKETHTKGGLKQDTSNKENNDVRVPLHQHSLMRKPNGAT